MKTIIKKIEDAQYYSPKAINGNAGKLLRYGKYHEKEVEFTIKKNMYSETIYCKVPRWQKFKIISFDWLVGSYDHNGVQKVGVSTLYNTEFIFSFYLHELVELLKELGSTDEIKSWQSQLENSRAE